MNDIMEIVLLKKKNLQWFLDKVKIQNRSQIEWINKEKLLHKLLAIQRCLGQRIVHIKHIKLVHVAKTNSDDDNYDEQVNIILMSSEHGILIN